ncbi:Ig-like domain-containing protein [Actinoplanes couchii]|uniref:Bacterial Ig-like domain-containing protein n=1 Tax=Actinoplanes couchii TaxID=403638 RepID=A0ABQ3XPV1_9ACTN|nr:Ig-like domain-containing protein [Actinoplanes couchii]MDR6323828.1 hypothetical protein [Actinoplanes couchii]GID60537.1 hypothetical protein Aco03nite_089410 [Actinoplanes couchii]
MGLKHVAAVAALSTSLILANAIPAAAAADEQAPKIGITSSTLFGPGRNELVATISDDTAVTRIEWFIDGAVRSTATRFYYDFGTRSRNLTVQVKAWDAAGNVTTLRFIVTVDAAAPTVTGVSPAAGALVRSRQITSVIRVADPAGADGFLFGGSPVQAGNGTLRSTLKVDRDGRAELLWGVWDSRGNERTVKRSVIVDTTKPALTVTKAPKNKAKVKGTLKVTASATDKNGIARVELLINGKVVATDTKAAYSFSINTRKFGKKIKFQLRAYDRAGNVRTTAARNWVRI